MAVIFSVLYPSADGKSFDQEYYNATHIPLVKEAFGATGLTGVQVFQGLPTPDGGKPPYVAMAHLTFADAAALQASMTSPRAGEVFADVAKFTDIQPVTQVSTPA
ncbi:EthD family reductase [Phenylobacterium sp.]|uniref:EthD family reductase n=1 Tax=Phenylobacterium sp. TaxID=1871053 RepID=UPI0035B27068